MRTLLKSALLLAPIVALPLLGGCHAASKATPYAALRSGCPAAKVKVIKQDGSDAQLDTCGVYEDWHWHAFNGWEYVGASANQPLAAPAPVADQDGDGVPDTVDACPVVAGIPSADPAKNGCPLPLDGDGDGIVDNEDACPTVAGVKSDVPGKNGCPLPLDADGDGVTDDVDACKDIPGVATTDPATNGCPGDRDGDTVRDDLDKCPDEAGEPNEDPALNGCPKGAIVVTDTQIVINDRIEFALGRSEIRKESFGLVDRIAQVLKDNPQIKKVEIQGHTDNTGPAQLNRNLSDARAKSVMKALAQRGIDKDRMTAKGYGPDRPVASNDTEEGKQKNRRVQFDIIDPPPPAAPAP
jgi:OmpA-OmpF porin, OOP family